MWPRDGFHRVFTKEKISPFARADLLSQTAIEWLQGNSLYIKPTIENHFRTIFLQ